MVTLRSDIKGPSSRSVEPIAMDLHRSGIVVETDQCSLVIVVPSTELPLILPAFITSR